MKPRNLITLAILGGFLSSALAQTPQERRGPRRGGPPSGEVPELTVNQPDAPTGFDVARPGVARGKIEPFEFTSQSGDSYRATIYTPHGVSPSKKLPVLYLLHGASGDENDWVETIHADAILDNLHSERKLVPMLVVMPSSLSEAGRREAGDRRDAKARASMAFGEVLVADLIPHVESHYPALSGREHRALAGLSMGAGTALSTGVSRSDLFAWVGAFSGAGRRWSEPRETLELLWLSVGDRDEMMAAGMVVADAYFTEKGVPHLFHVNSGGHEPRVWMNDLYHFAPLLFQP